MALSDIIDIRKAVRATIKKAGVTKKYKVRKLSKIKKLVLHCTDGFSNIWGTLHYDLSIKNHITPGEPLPGLTYHYFCDKDGQVEWTMPLEDITWHAGKWNSDSIGFVLQYRATGNKNTPPFNQMRAAYQAVADICLGLKIEPKNVYGHRETGAKKSCPGKLVDMNDFRKYVIGIMQKTLKDAGLYTGEIDGKFGPLSLKALKVYKTDYDFTWDYKSEK